MVSSSLSRYGDLFVIIAAALAAILAFAGDIYVSLLVIAAALITYLSGRGKNGTNADVQLFGFVKSFAAYYKRSRNIASSIKESAGSSAFEKKLMKALDRYESGDSASFAKFWHGGIGNVHEAELVSLVSRSVTSGEDVYPEICRMKYNIANNINEHLNTTGQMNNARFVSLMGISVFFPLFAGIGTAILVSAPQIGAHGWINPASIMLVFAAYLSIESSIHFRNDPSMREVRKASSAVLCSSVGMFLMKAGSLLAISAI